MRSWDVFSPTPFTTGGNITTAFLRYGVLDYKAAARYVSQLPYGRNGEVAVTTAVLHEGCGTCSTKHALLRRLAAEQGLDIVLVLGIYEMNQQNTPAVGPVLERYGLSSLPEAHCYLRVDENRVDVTHDRKKGQSTPMLVFRHEEDIAPEQIGDYKIELHRRFMSRWMAETDAGVGRSLDEVCRIREECIRVLSGRAEMR